VNVFDADLDLVSFPPEQSAEENKLLLQNKQDFRFREKKLIR
jgi:hypothetical protein